MYIKARLNISLATYTQIFCHNYSYKWNVRSQHDPDIANLFKKQQLFLQDNSKLLGIMRMIYQTVLRCLKGQKEWAIKAQIL